MRLSECLHKSVSAVRRVLEIRALSMQKKLCSSALISLQKTAVTSDTRLKFITTAPEKAEVIKCYLGFFFFFDRKFMFLWAFIFYL